MAVPLEGVSLMAGIRIICAGFLFFSLSALTTIAAEDSEEDNNPVATPPYDSTVDTAFDIIRSTDVSSFSCLKYRGRLKRQIWDKRVDGEPEINAFLFDAYYGDGLQIKFLLNPEFGSIEAARKEAKRYTYAIGQLPVVLRRGIKYFSIHKGNEGFHAGHEQIVVYSDRATIRIKDNHLEESLFHEAVHASWDEEHRLSSKWVLAQQQDKRFLTRYAEGRPEREDLAETALFAFALLHFPSRIPPVDAQIIRDTVPARIELLDVLLPTEKRVSAAAETNPACS